MTAFLLDFCKFLKKHKTDSDRTSVRPLLDLTPIFSSDLKPISAIGGLPVKTTEILRFKSELP